MAVWLCVIPELGDCRSSFSLEFLEESGRGISKQIVSIGFGFGY